MPSTPVTLKPTALNRSTSHDLMHDPIATFVVKVASRCNLKCTYCYMYEHPDQTWRTLPQRMSQTHVLLLAKRIADYISVRHDLSRILVIAHGGEPSLFGISRLDSFFFAIRNAVDEANRLFDRDVTVDFGMQTNGTRISDELVAVLRRHDIRAGVSLDGPPEANLERVDKHGAETTDLVLGGIRALRNPFDGGASLFGGVLAVVQPEIPPHRVLEFFRDQDIRQIDFLIPDLNHDTFSSAPLASGDVGRWLCTMYDLWKPVSAEVNVRTFVMLQRLIAGARVGYDAIGLRSRGVCVIETDGTYHRLDSLKTCYDGATHTGLSLECDPILQLEDDWTVRALAQKADYLCDQCRACPVVDVCGGGYLPHRYSSINGFDNPSVFCDDLILVIDHITRDLFACLSQAAVQD